MKTGMPLHDEIGLAGNPEAVPVGMRDHDGRRFVGHGFMGDWFGNLLGVSARLLLSATGECNSEKANEQQGQHDQPARGVFELPSRLHKHRQHLFQTAIIVFATTKRWLPGSNGTPSARNSDGAPSLSARRRHSITCNSSVESVFLADPKTAKRECPRQGNNA